MPPHPHPDQVPFAREPWKTLYVAQRLTTTLLLVPVWATFYLLTPRSWRPRESWSIKQIIAVRFTRRIHKVTEMAGVVWGTRDHTKEPKQSSLEETRFQWTDPLPEEFRKGIVNDQEVPFVRVGTFVWPRHSKKLADSNSAQGMSFVPSDRACAQGCILCKAAYCKSKVIRQQLHRAPAHWIILRILTWKLWGTSQRLVSLCTAEGIATCQRMRNLPPARYRAG